jgi:hypothetical protein
MPTTSRRILVGTLSAIVASSLLALLHSPPWHSSNIAWAHQSALIASGGIGFAVVCFLEGVLVDALPQVALALGIPFIPMLLYLRSKNVGLLALTVVLWVLIGWMATVGTTF